MLDGFEELEDDEMKEKIKSAIDQGRVDDADWKHV